MSSLREQMSADTKVATATINGVQSLVEVT